jgi:hypothetical protein
VPHLSSVSQFSGVSVCHRLFSRFIGDRSS